MEKRMTGALTVRSEPGSPLAERRACCGSEANAEEGRRVRVQGSAARWHGMIVPKSEIANVYHRIKRDAGGDGVSVVIMVAPDVDAICACKMLTVRARARARGATAGRSGPPASKPAQRSLPRMPRLTPRAERRVSTLGRARTAVWARSHSCGLTL